MVKNQLPLPRFLPLNKFLYATKGIRTLYTYLTHYIQGSEEFFVEDPDSNQESHPFG